MRPSVPCTGGLFRFYIYLKKGKNMCNNEHCHCENCTCDPCTCTEEDQCGCE